MKMVVASLLLFLTLGPTLVEARCRTIGESASLGTEHGTFPLYPARRLVETGEQRDNGLLQWVGYGLGAPLFVVALPFAMVGAGVGALLHPWTACPNAQDEDRN